MASVTLDQVTKVYDDAQGTEVAVREADLDIEDGEFVVIVGPSGCGKSTTLRMIGGLESVTQGTIQIGDRIVNDVAPRHRDIAMVFQNYALYPHKTVRGNMGYGLELSTDLSDDEINERVEDVAELLGITELLDKKPSALSGGQQQRVATGRAIVREPSVFLFDEPLSNLDAKLRTHMRTELLRLHSELGITSIYVTHDQEEAMTMADHIVVMNGGEIQQIGTPKEIYYGPTNLFVADFVGSPSINLFDVELDSREDGSAVLVNRGFEYAVSTDIVAAVESAGGSRELILGIRPESIRVVDDDPSVDAERSIHGTVDVVETIGSDNYVYLDIDGQECRVRTGTDNEPEEGSTVTATFDESNIYLFDRDTERMLYSPLAGGRDAKVAVSSD